MHYRQILLSGLLMFSCACYAQNHKIESILQAIETNNPDLKAKAASSESRRLELKSTNTLSNPEAGMYYMPWGDHAAGDYTEYQVTQEFDFPTLYGIRGDLIKLVADQMDFDYHALRQDILLQAKKACVELVFLNKIQSLETVREAEARQVFEQMQVMYDKGQVGILDYNKAKIAALEQSFRVVDFQAQIKNLESQLTTLNGGAPIELTLTAFDNEIVLPSFDVLWEEKRHADPWLLRLAMEEDISQNQIRLSKSQRLPSITAGYNQQGVAGDVYSGVYAGLSIPLWSGGKQVQLAKANAHFQSIAVESNLQRKRSEVEQSYNTYLFLLDQMQELRSTLANQQSEQLLKTAYEMGELSYLDYYRELQFFQSAANRLLDLEKRLHLVKSELLKHRL